MIFEINRFFYFMDCYRAVQVSLLHPFHFPGSKNYEIVATGLHAPIYRKGNILVYMLFQLGY